MSKSSLFQPHPRLDPLLSRLCAGELAPQAASELRELLESDDSALEAYVAQMNLHAELMWRLGEVGPGCEVAAVEPVELVSRKPRGWFSARTAAVAACALLVAYFIGMSVFVALPNRGQHQPAAARHAAPVATLAAGPDARWSSSSAVVTPQAEVLPGEQFTLESGTVELQLAQGAALAIEGPARWSIDGRNAATLSLGRLVARVPQQAVGFVLTTPSAQIVDLGTEFGVEVSDSGAAEVRVLRGEVQVQSNGQGGAKSISQKRLNAGQAIQVLADGSYAPAPSNAGSSLVRTPSTDDRPFRQSYREVILADKPIAYWPLDEAPGATAAQDLSGNGHAGLVRGELKFGVAGPIANSSGAARFDGASWLQIARPEPLALTHNFTVETWLRPASIETVSRVLSVEQAAGRGGWGFGCMPRGFAAKGHQASPHNTVLFTLYKVQDFPFVETSWPADGRWHHLAIVCDGGVDATLFLDGRWVASVEGNQPGLEGVRHAAIGQRTDGTQCFQGDVAHLAIYGRALNEQQIGERLSLVMTGSDAVGPRGEGAESRQGAAESGKTSQQQGN